MPTLNDKNTFSFRENIEVPEVYRNLTEEWTAINIILKILTEQSDNGVSGRNNKTDSDKVKCYFLQGRTGSGKSTLFISRLYQILCQKKNKSLICTQPRISLTKSNAQSIAHFNEDIAMGINIGYQTGSEVLNPSSESHIKFVTTQILANMVLNLLTERSGTKLSESEVKNENNKNERSESGIDKNNDRSENPFENVEILVLDEVHVMDKPMIMLLYYIKECFRLGIELPLVIFQSATFDVEMYVKYLFDYNESLIQDILNDYRYIGYVAGESNYLVEEQYINMSQNSNSVGFIAEVLRDCCKGVLESRDKNILVFVPTKNMIKTTGEHLYEYLHEEYPVFVVQPTSKLDDVMNWRNRNRNVKRVLVVGYARDYGNTADYLNTNNSMKSFEEKMNEIQIYIATTIVEVGKTYSGLGVCVDTGIANNNVVIPMLYNINYPIQGNRLIPINYNQYIQRKGRVGRNTTGVFIGLYDKELLNEIDEFEVPQIYTSRSLSTSILEEILRNAVEWNEECERNERSEWNAVERSEWNEVEECDRNERSEWNEVTKYDRNDRSETNVKEIDGDEKVENKKSVLLIDPLNYNPYINKASVDTLLLTIRDLIGSCLISYDLKPLVNKVYPNTYYLALYLSYNLGFSMMDSCIISVSMKTMLEDMTDFSSLKKVEDKKTILEKLNDKKKIDLYFEALEVYMMMF